mmetsp:Transcript_14062/g.39378  ORF Transcript_14062/g.39378 Transcript_14062/m.39378 type:complete len:216 (-) Transcript_14062:913-1560(-)
MAAVIPLALEKFPAVFLHNYDGKILSKNSLFQTHPVGKVRKLMSPPKFRFVPLDAYGQILEPKTPLTTRGDFFSRNKSQLEIRCHSLRDNGDLSFMPPKNGAVPWHRRIVQGGLPRDDWFHGTIQRGAFPRKQFLCIPDLEWIVSEQPQGIGRPRISKKIVKRERHQRIAPDMGDHSPPKILLSRSACQVCSRDQQLQKGNPKTEPFGPLRRRER